MTTHRLVVALGVVALLTFRAAVPAAQEADRGGPVRVAAALHRDVPLAAGESVTALVVLGGDAVVAGKADFVLVIGGTARLLPSAIVGTLSVVRGRGELHGGAFVAHDVWLVDGQLARSPGAVVGGEIVRGYWSRLSRGVRLFGVLIGIGISLALLLGAVIAVGVAPDAVRRAGAELTDHPALAGLASVLLWLAVPWIALFLAVTVVGIPIGLGFWIFVLPTLGFVGYLVSATTLGRALVSRARDGFDLEHPYLAAASGVSALLVVGLVPVLGAIVSVVAATVGAGAVVVAAVRGAMEARKATAGSAEERAPVHPAPPHGGDPVRHA